MSKIIQLAAVKTAVALNDEEAWRRYLEAKHRAEQTESLEDALDARRRLHDFYERGKRSS